MSENREEILADFQACTGMEDVAMAIYHLENSNWDLVRAVSKAMSPEVSSYQASRNYPDVMIVDDDNVPAVPIESASAGMDGCRNADYPTVNNLGFSRENLHQPSTSRGSPRKKLFKFIVRYNEKSISIELPDTATINDLKLVVDKNYKVPPCRQLLIGWPKKSQDENTPFSDLIINRENTLDLHVKTADGSVDAIEENDIIERLNGTFNLSIKYNGQVFNLKFRGTTPILEVKNGIYALTNIEVRNQLWSGWPPNIDDKILLALSGIDYPDHEFIVSRNAAASSSNNTTRNKQKKSNSAVINLDSDEDEFEDASESFNVDDDYFVEDVSARKTEPLIPDNIDDEIIGTLTFCERFTTRYGPIHPAFFQGSLEEAIQEACNKPARDRKILAIYLHHDSSVLTNVFCTQLLGFESVMQIFEKNFVLWGWDLTFPSNFNKLQQSVSTNLGSVASLSMRNIPVDRLPAIVLIMRIRSSTDIFNIVYGNVGVNELLSSLIETVEVFTDNQRVEMKEEQERAERELVKWEQDQAYRESLEADRAKEEAKRSKEEAEKEAKMKLENEQAEEMRKKEEYRMEVEKGLPPEPTTDERDITQIRFRLPGGEQLERRFFISTPLKVLLDFLIVKSYPSEEYKVISSWPRRDLTAVDPKKTLEELKLYPQETVILEER